VVLASVDAMVAATLCVIQCTSACGSELRGNGNVVLCSF
jgi:hypothetical protein